MFGSFVSTRLLYGPRLLILLSLTLSAIPWIPKIATAESAPAVSMIAQEVRTTWMAKYGLVRPTGLTYTESLDEFLIIGEDEGGERSGLRLGPDETARGVVEAALVSSAQTLSYDSSTDRVTSIHDGAVLEISAKSIARGRPAAVLDKSGWPSSFQPISATYDAITGDSLLLGSDGKLARVAHDGSLTIVRIQTSDARLIAFDRQTDRLYILDGAATLTAFDSTNRSVHTFEIGPLGLVGPTAMVFAPTSDCTDEPSNLNLFIADSGGNFRTGGLM